MPQKSVKLHIGWSTINDTSTCVDINICCYSTFRKGLKKLLLDKQ